jgi:type I restriction enzyme M protein
MNLAIAGSDAQIAHGSSFHNDRHVDVKADCVLANLPFNDSGWRREFLKGDKRSVSGTPSAGRARVQHIGHRCAGSAIFGIRDTHRLGVV